MDAPAYVNPPLPLPPPPSLSSPLNPLDNAIRSKSIYIKNESEIDALKSINDLSLSQIEQRAQKITDNTTDVDWSYPFLSTFHSPLSTLHSPLSTLHSPLSTLHSPLSTLPSPLSTLHSPLSTLHSPLSTLHSPLSTLHSPFLSFLPSLPSLPSLPLFPLFSSTLIYLYIDLLMDFWVKMKLFKRG